MTAVVVATDLSEASDEAVVQARAFAGPHRSLHAITILPRLSSASTEALFPHDTLATQLSEADVAERAVRTVEARIQALLEGGAASVDVRARVGEPEEEIAALVHELGAFAVVVGSHGRTGLSRMLLGSVAERIARTAPSHELVARPAPSASGTPPTVVLATDLSDVSERALELAVTEARRLSARLLVVHAIDNPRVLAYTELAAALGVSFPGPPAELEQEVRASLERLIGRAAAGAAGAEEDAVPFEIVIANGEPVRSVVREATASSSSLLVIGSSKHGRLERLALGSVAGKLVRHAPCSVLVVRR